MEKPNFQSTSDTNIIHSYASFRLAAADAQSAAISKALVHSKVSNSLIAKLYMGVANQYDTANGLLSSLPSSEIASDLKRYLSDGTAFYKVYYILKANPKHCEPRFLTWTYFICSGYGKKAPKFRCRRESVRVLCLCCPHNL
jgi:hypothetical protein